MPNLLINPFPIADGGGDLIAQDVAMPQSEPMDGGLDRALRQAEPRPDFGVTARPTLTRLQVLQLLEQLRFARSRVFLPQAFDRAVHQSLRPSALENAVRRQGLERLKPTAFLS